MGGKLRIGVDCRVLSRVRSGIGLSLEFILAELAGMDTGCEFFLFSNREFDFEDGCPGFHKVIDAVHRRMPGTAWLHLVLPRLLRRHGIDVFLGYEHVVPAASGIPSVLNICDLTYLRHPETMSATSYWMNRLFIPASLRRCAAFVTISEYTMQTVLEAFPFAAGKARKVVHLAGTLGKTEPGEPREVLDRLGVCEPYILTVGSFEPRKNLPALVRAFASAVDPCHRLVMVGASAWKTEALDRLAQEVPPEALGRVMMLRGISKSDLKRLYMQAELFVLPSLFEGFGMPVVEAMECGTPVLSSKAASLPEVGGDAVAYFDPSDESDLADRLASLTGSPSERGKLGKLGLERAALFTWRNTAGQLLQVLTKAAASGEHGL